MSQQQSKSDYVMIPVQPRTKEQLYDRKEMHETWDETMRRIAELERE